MPERFRMGLLFESHTLLRSTRPFRSIVLMWTLLLPRIVHHNEKQPIAYQELKKLVVRALVVVLCAHHVVCAYTSQRRVTSSSRQELQHYASRTRTRKKATTTAARDIHKSLSQEHHNEPYATWIDPETNCRVILLGCVHGSPSSTAAMERIFAQTRPSAIVLELCASRYLSLQRALDAAAASNNRNNYTSDSTNDNINLLASSTTTTNQGKGISRGIATTILGVASELQSKLSGFEPGLEFKRAIIYANNSILLKGSGTNNINGCDIILADRDVSETLRRMEDLPNVCWQFFLQSIVHGRMDPIHTEFSNFKTAIWGDDYLRRQQTATQIDVGKVLFRNWHVIRDLSQLTIPPLIIVSLVFHVAAVGIDLLLHLCFIYFGTNASTSVTPDSIITTSTLTQLTAIVTANDKLLLSPLSMFETVSTITGSNIVISIMETLLVVWVAFMFLALPLTKVILTERDTHLACGVRDACRIVASKRSNGELLETGDNTATTNTVVVILGLLHVNGIAKLRLLNHKKDLALEESNNNTYNESR